MGKKVHYSEEIKWEAVRMRQQGFSHSQIKSKLGIKDKKQIQTWVHWYNAGEAYRFSQPVGKQYSYGKGPDDLSELEAERIKNKRLEAQLEILKKYQEIERSWSQRLLFK
jgi:transposase